MGTHIRIQQAPGSRGPGSNHKQLNSSLTTKDCIIVHSCSASIVKESIV